MDYCTIRDAEQTIRHAARHAAKLARVEGDYLVIAYYRGDETRLAGFDDRQAARRWLKHRMNEGAIVGRFADPAGGVLWAIGNQPPQEWSPVSPTLRATPKHQAAKVLALNGGGYIIPAVDPLSYEALVLAIGFSPKTGLGAHMTPPAGDPAPDVERALGYWLVTLAGLRRYRQTRLRLLHGETNIRYYHVSNAGAFFDLETGLKVGGGGAL